MSEVNSMKVRFLVLALGSLIAAGCGGSSGSGSSSPPANRPPVADAGGDQQISEGESLVLAGQGSDPDGDTITYAWSQVSGPTLTLDSVSDPDSGLTAPEVPIGNSVPSVLRLTVTDASGASASDDVEVQVVSTDFLVYRDGPDLFKYDPETDSRLELSALPASDRSTGAYALSPDGQYVLYGADQDTNDFDELFVVGVDGAGNTKVSAFNQPGETLREFKWSPDGSRIAYVTNLPQAPFRAVYVVDRDGSNHQFVDRHDGIAPTFTSFNEYLWSPDSRYLAFLEGQTGGTSRISIYDDETGTGISQVLVSVVNAGGQIFRATWSPSEARLSYHAIAQAGGQSEVFSILPDGTENQRVSGPLVAGGGVNPVQAWAPDGSWFAYLATQDDANELELFISRPDGSENLKLSRPLLSPNGIPGFVWAPDASRLFYQAAQDIADQLDLYSVRTDASENTKINGPTLGLVQVGPDYAVPLTGGRIGYRAAQAVSNPIELFTSLEDGSDDLRLSIDLDPFGDVEEGFRWSPNSLFVAYRADVLGDDAQELYVSPVDGSGGTKVSRDLVAGDDVNRRFSWSADSSRLAYVFEDTFDLIMVAPDGTEEVVVSNAASQSDGGFVWSP